MAHLWIAQTTVAHSADAETLARAAIEQGLAACVQIESGLTSVFRWEGKLEQDAEIRLTFKTTADHLPALRALVLEEHPYQVPEWIAWPIADVNAAYLAWAEAQGPETEE